MNAHILYNHSYTKKKSKTINFDLFANVYVGTTSFLNDVVVDVTSSFEEEEQCNILNCTIS